MAEPFPSSAEPAPARGWDPETAGLQAAGKDFPQGCRAGQDMLLSGIPEKPYFQNDHKLYLSGQQALPPSQQTPEIS